MPNTQLHTADATQQSSWVASAVCIWLKSMQRDTYTRNAVLSNGVVFSVGVDQLTADEKN